jgi:hypothetical protein
MSEDLPITVDTATMNVNSSMTNSSAAFTIINNGKVNNGTDNALPTGSKLTLGGGTYNLNGYSQNLTTLAVNSDSTINFAGTGPTNPRVLTFTGDSSGIAWGAGAFLRLNWNGSLAGGGTDQIKIASSTNLSPAQLGAIHFTSYLTGAGATVLPSGELVPSSTTRLWRGDVDGSGKNSPTSVVPTIGDVDKLMAALINVPAYANNTIPGGNGYGATLNSADLLDVADVNSDKGVNNLDLQALIVATANGVPLPGPGGGSLTAVPEPSSVLLLGLGGVMLALRRVRRQPAGR